MFLLESLGSFWTCILYVVANSAWGGRFGTLLWQVTGNNFAGLSNSKDVIAIYVGDDRTDEDAFKVIVLIDDYGAVGEFSHLII